MPGDTTRAAARLAVGAGTPESDAGASMEFAKPLVGTTCGRMFETGIRAEVCEDNGVGAFRADRAGMLVAGPSSVWLSLLDALAEVSGDLIMRNVFVGAAHEATSLADEPVVPVSWAATAASPVPSLFLPANDCQTEEDLNETEKGATDVSG